MSNPAPVYVDVDVTWAVPDGSKVTRTAIFARKADEVGAWVKIGTFEGNKATLHKCRVGTRYEVAAAGVAADGTVADEALWSVGYVTPGGTTTQPTAPSGLGVAQDGEYLEATWKDVANGVGEFDHYELRWGPSWVAGRVVGKPTEAKYRWKWETSGSNTLHVCTIDRFGLRSTAATKDIYVRALPDHVTGTTQDEGGGGFTGTKSGTQVVGGKLGLTLWGEQVIDNIEDVIDDCDWLPDGKFEGTYTTGEIDLGSARLVRLEVALAASPIVWDPTIATVQYEIDPYEQDQTYAGTAVDLFDEDQAVHWGEALIDGDESPTDVKIEVRAGTATPLSAGYQPYTPGVYYGRYVQFRVTLRSWDRHRNTWLSTLQIIERKQNLKDEGSVAVTGSPGPTSISFATGFIDTPNLTAISDREGCSVKLVTISKTAADVRVFDADGAEVFTGNVYWIAAGT